MRLHRSWKAGWSRGHQSVITVRPIELLWRLGEWLCIILLRSGGLAQLGEHYVRNVGVGGSTPLPSTKPRLRVQAALQAKPLPIVAAG